MRPKAKAEIDWINLYWSDQDKVWFRIDKDNSVSFIPEDQGVIPVDNDEPLVLSSLPVPLVGAVERVRDYKQPEYIVWTCPKHGQLHAGVKVLKDGVIFIEVEIRHKDPSYDWGVYDHLPVGVLIADASFDIRYINSVLREMIGCEWGEEVLGKQPSDFLHKEDWSLIRAALKEEPITREKAYEDVFRLRKHDGSYRWFKGIVTVVPDVHGEPDHYVGVVVSIDEEKSIESKLRRSEDRLRSIFYHAQAGVVLTNSDARIVAANDAFCEIVGYKTEKELRGISLPTLTIAEDRLVEKELFDDMLSEHKSHYRIEKRYMHREGHSIWADVIVSVIWDDDGRPANFISIIQNIQRAKENEERMVALNELKDKFFSIISHDLKNPLNAIMGLTDLAIESGKRDQFDEVMDMVEMIKISSHRIHDLLVNVLDWSRNQQGVLKFNPKQLSVDALVGDVLDLLETSLHQKNIRLELRLEKDRRITADGHMLKSILLNLLTNAMKYSMRGESIELIVEKAGSESLRFIVKDYGRGMTDQQISDIYDMNIEKRSNGTEDEPGTGLGLILVQEFVQAHGSQLKIESVVGKGTTFRFDLPIGTLQ